MEKNIKPGHEMTRESIESYLKDRVEILIKKNSDYEGASFDRGLAGNELLVWNKAKRYRSLVKKIQRGEEPHFEGIRDTLGDLLGYCVIGLHILDSGKIKDE